MKGWRKEEAGMRRGQDGLLACPANRSIPVAGRHEAICEPSVGSIRSAVRWRELPSHRQKEGSCEHEWRGEPGSCVAVAATDPAQSRSKNECTTCFHCTTFPPSLFLTCGCSTNSPAAEAGAKKEEGSPVLCR